MTSALLAIAVLALAIVAILVTVRVIRIERRWDSHLQWVDDRTQTVDRTIAAMRGTMREYADDVDQIYEWAQSWAEADEQAPVDVAVVNEPMTPDEQAEYARRWRAEVLEGSGTGQPAGIVVDAAAVAEQWAEPMTADEHVDQIRQIDPAPPTAPDVGSDAQADDDVVDAEIACGWEPAPGVAWPTTCDYPNGPCRGYGSPGCSMKAEEAQPIPDLAPGPDGRLEVVDADPPTREIPRVGAHRSDTRATRAAGRALREGADEESTR